jgi:Helix-turn-helix domain
MAELRIDSAELRPVIEAVVAQVMTDLEKPTRLFNGRLAVTETEAADMLGLHPWQLRDLRLAGNIGYCRIVGNRIRYTREDLLGYLRQRHEDVDVAARKNGRRR